MNSGSPQDQEFSSVLFSGEESARFARFASAALSAGLSEIEVHAEGREPLTSRPVIIAGALTGAMVDGYIRFITVREHDSGISHNIAGSNATRSIAARNVRFALRESQMESLREWAGREQLYVPRLPTDALEGASEFAVCEQALAEPSEAAARAVLALTASENPAVRAEAALTIRGLSGLINNNKRLQRDAEEALIGVCLGETDRDALVAAIEDLGYIGDDASKSFLAKAIAESKIEQASWAAAIALGRLNGGEEIWRPLLAGLDAPLLWARRASLLSLARRGHPDVQIELEPVFAKHLGVTEDDLMRRYACLGLSRFITFEQATWDLLITILADDNAPLGTKGYAALAIAGAYQYCPEEYRTRIENILGTIPRDGDLRDPEIDSVWSLEYLGELASICGKPHIASRLYKNLSAMFSDWRAQYYMAISLYELGEAESRGAEGEDAIVRFTEAIRALDQSNKTLAEVDAATVEFRRTIITARRQLQALFASWLDTNEHERLRNLASAAAEIQEQYRRYANPDALVGRDRQLVRRELDYLKTTVSFLDLLRRLISIDASIRVPDLADRDVGSVADAVAQADEVAQTIEKRFEDVFNLPLHKLLTDVRECLKLLSEAVTASFPLVEKLKLMRGYLGQVRAAFWSSSWPLPGRACPVYGLGRAAIKLRPGPYVGSGTWTDQIRFQKGEAPLLPLYVQIIDMATGGTAELLVRYTVGEVEKEVRVHAVEGEYPIPIDMRPYAVGNDWVIEVRAVFQTRDCIQEADRVTYHIRTDA